MIRGIPFRIMIPLLFVLWALATVLVYRFAPRLRGRRLRIALWGLTSALVAFILIALVAIPAVTAFN